MSNGNNVQFPFDPSMEAHLGPETQKEELATPTECKK